MKIALLGTGLVGQTLAGKLNANGHEVVIGTRDPAATMARTEVPYPGVPTFVEWHADHEAVKLTGFADAAREADLIILAVPGGHAVETLKAADVAGREGLLVIDVSNPLDTSAGVMPPPLSVVNTDSVGEQLQRAFPEQRIVKTLNTVNAAVMVAPHAVADGDHTLFLSGDDVDAKATVRTFLEQELGWHDILDLGDITTARGAEMYLALWMRTFAALGTPLVNVKVVSTPVS